MRKVDSNGRIPLDYVRSLVTLKEIAIAFEKRKVSKNTYRRTAIGVRCYTVQCTKNR